ncbi:MAG: OmpH family outer membrane protein [Planctomycetes bacterium]|nr:OmpH family outer membrane protein [Planctomycetota bacterium]
MKRLFPVALVLLACAAGFAGGLIRDSLKETEPVDTVSAAPPRAKSGAIRIAVINLEEASRQSRRFNELKGLWDAAQNELKAQDEKMEDEYNRKLAELRRARDEGERTDLRVELQSIQEARKASKDEQQKYLASLLAQYQKDVLKMVMGELEGFVKREGYDIVLQDYEVDTANSDFFSGGAYAQTLMSKPVLYAPGIKDKKNEYVVDITQAIIDLVKDK